MVECWLGPVGVAPEFVENVKASETSIRFQGEGGAIKTIKELFGM